ncbi:Nicotinate phosphoribosyltransferase [Parelaphostrongylus tenuis]|uniref:Nicotinate phosphoribosyltransferase n=1 Tax=Parelaphostrongylus tenuis TaxID=148309 RepID=A0AAD5WJI0_PARTN|nr:Nicotinate phosphoribosyltransferase [Parelaphostrongylus tenuis]
MVLINDPDTSGSSAMGDVYANRQHSLVQPLLTDFYQITMCYGYWLAGKHDESAVFDLFFRENPFHGEFTIFAGFEECLRFVENFRFNNSDIEFIREILSEDCDPDFLQYLTHLDCSKLKIKAIPEGSVVFPRVPLITVDGPLAVCQLMESTFLNLVNFASLVATNASRFRQAAGDKVQLLEFGLRRAQGPNGAISASRYCYIGGFDGTSNVLAGRLFGIPLRGTHAHSFICSFASDDDLQVRFLRSMDGSVEEDLYSLSKEKRHWMMEKAEWGVLESEVNDGELAAFVAYAIAFPTSSIFLIDTYDVLRSGVINFVAVTLALFELGYRSVGCRIDSGDLAYLSKQVRSRLRMVAELEVTLHWIKFLKIVASNDINEETIISLNQQSHEINSFGIGTHLVTCQKQPALGCVYKV